MQKLNEICCKIINRTSYPLPEYATAGAAGMDLYCALAEERTLKFGERLLVPTGISIELPEGYEAQIRPRSGLAAKHGVTILNAPSTIDSDYRGEVFVLLINLGAEDFILRPGKRVAQMVVASFSRLNWSSVADLTPTQRGSGGFGHTGE